MFLEIINPKEILYSGEVNLVQLPGSLSSFEILKNHAHIISNLKSGNVRIIDNVGLEKIIPITGGVVENRNNHIIILTDGI